VRGGESEFDDGAKGQYRILADGSLDPDCAVGIMQEAAKSGNWAPRASFFPLLDQLGSKRQEKLRNLVQYVSDGDPTTVSTPKSLPAQLGIMRTDLGRPVVRY
jgi:hypothetical protein